MSNLKLVNLNLDHLKTELQELHGQSFGWALVCCNWNHCEAEDALQAAYIKVLEGRARFQARSSLKTWFFSVIRLTAMETRRTQRTRKDLLFRRWEADPATTSPEEYAHDPLQLIDQCEEKQRLSSALAKLARRQREILELVFYQDLSIAQSAVIMGISVGTARTHYERAKAEVHKLLLSKESPLSTVAA
jgi:RNA polymerase sigma-70 factor, ECF subfamily